MNDGRYSREGGECPRCGGRGFVTSYRPQPNAIVPAIPDGLKTCPLCEGSALVPIQPLRPTVPPEPPNETIGGGGVDKKELGLWLLWGLSCIGCGLIGYALGAL